MADEQAVDSTAQEGIDAQTAQAETSAPDTTPEDKASAAATEQAQEAQEPPKEGDKPEGEVTDKGGAEDDTTEEQEHYFGGERVQVEVPDDLRTSLKDAGIDVDAVVGELYAKEGEFALSDSTKDQLYKVYGKGIVDSYLNAIKSQNERALADHQGAQASEQERAEQAAQWATETVGGQETWDAMQSWLEQDTSTVSDAEIEGFNAAMSSGNKYIQELALKAMKSKYVEANGDGPGISLVEGSGEASSALSPLSSQDYIKEVSKLGSLPSKDRKAAQAELDARRRAGQAKGI